jgi:hypothetical protein
MSGLQQHLKIDQDAEWRDARLQDTATHPIFHGLKRQVAFLSLKIPLA